MKNEFYREKDRIYFRFYYNPEIISAIKEIEGRRYDPNTREWSIPISILNKGKIESLIKTYGFNPLEDVQGRKDINTLLSTKISLERLKNYREEVKSLGLKFTLRDYQQVGVNLMNHFGNCINGDDMGLGKTIQTIYAVETMSNFPCLVICPSSVKYHWDKFWKEANPNRSTSIITSGSPNNNFDADVVIMNYDIVGKSEIYEDKDGEEKKRVHVRFPELLKPWECMVLDEIHMIKNSKTNRSKSIKQILKTTKRKIGLTGTIVQNKPIEIVNPLMIIDKFGQFGNWKNFTDRYCDAKETRFGLDLSGSSNTLELNEILRNTCYIRREKREVYSELPDLQVNVENIEITNLREYIRAEDNFLDYVDETFSEEKAEKAYLAEFLVQRNLLRQMSVRGKIKGLIEWFENYQESTSEKLVVFGVHKEPLMQLALHFGGELVDGSMNAQEKHIAVQGFEKSKEQFIWGNIQALGTGTDGLQHAASNMAMIELPDNPAKIDQTVARIERIGQTLKMNLYYLLSDQTIDVSMWHANEAKRVIMEAINKGRDVKPVSFNDVLIKNIRQRRNK